MKLAKPFLLVVPVALFLASNTFRMGIAGPIAGLTIGFAFAIYLLASKRRYDLAFPILGGAMDAVAILANGGKMPVFNPPPASLDFAHVAFTNTTHLRFLCDVIPVGHFAVLSAGDLLIIGAWPMAILFMRVKKTVANRREREVAAQQAGLRHEDGGEGLTAASMNVAQDQQQVA